MIGHAPPRWRCMKAATPTARSAQASVTSMGSVRYSPVQTAHPHGTGDATSGETRGSEERPCIDAAISERQPRTGRDTDRDLKITLMV
jgi:hypothetical protein